MAVKATHSDIERFARNRVLIASVTIYLLGMGFMYLGDRIYAGTPHLVYSRLATVPLFLLLVIRWLRLVRVHPPQALREARQLLSMDRYRAAREAYARVLALTETGGTVRIDRARRLLQDGLAIGVAEEALIGMGRCSFNLGEMDRASDELGRAQARLPRRADIAIEHAEVLLRLGRRAEAADLLRAALPHLDPIDLQTIEDRAELRGLLEGIPLPRRSRFFARIVGQRLILAGLIGIAVLHGLHLYLGLF